MPIIQERDRQVLTEKFAAELTNPVRLVHFTKEPLKLFLPGQSPESTEYLTITKELLEEVAGLSDKISLEVHDVGQEPELAQEYGADKLPAIFLARNGERNVRYFGIPAGYEFSAFIQDILFTSTGETGLAEETKQALAAIDADIQIQVFVTPT